MPARRQHATGCRSGVQRRHWLLASAAALAGCDRGVTSPPPAVLHMAMDLWAGYFPVLLAIELGMMAERGLTVDVTMPGNTDRMMAEFAAGRYDIVGMALADLLNLTRGAHDVQVFIHSDESSGGDKLLSRAGFHPAGGRVIVGTNLGGFGELFVREVAMTVAGAGVATAVAQQALEARCDAAGIMPARVVVRQGVVADEIDHAAVAEGAGLVVMGLQARGDRGAVATAVLKGKDALVLAVPA